MKTGLLGFVGGFLVIGISPILLVTEHYMLGGIIIIAGLAIIDYVRDGN